MTRFFKLALKLIARGYYFLLSCYLTVIDRPEKEPGPCLACGADGSLGRVVTRISAGSDPFLYFQKPSSRMLISVKFLAGFPKIQWLIIGYRETLGKRIRNIPYYECQSCGSHYQRIGFKTKEAQVILGEFYSTFYRLGVAEYGRIEWLNEPRFLKLRDHITRTVDDDANHLSKKFLDCGCGEGILGFLLEREGFDTYGIEPSKAMINFAINQLGLAEPKYKAEIYTRESYPPQTFDYINSYHVIEHVVDPVAYIQNIFFHLKPGGLAFVSTPSAQLSESSLSKSDGLNYGPLHLFLLSMKWFEVYARRVGFEIISSETFPYDGIPGSLSPRGEKPCGMNFLLKKSNPRILL